MTRKAGTILISVVIILVLWGVFESVIPPEAREQLIADTQKHSWIPASDNEHAYLIHELSKNGDGYASVRVLDRAPFNLFRGYSRNVYGFDLKQGESLKYTLRGDKIKFKLKLGYGISGGHKIETKYSNEVFINGQKAAGDETVWEFGGALNIEQRSYRRMFGWLELTYQDDVVFDGYYVPNNKVDYVTLRPWETHVYKDKVYSERIYAIVSGDFAQPINLLVHSNVHVEKLTDKSVYFIKPSSDGVLMIQSNGETVQCCIYPIK
ncbi:hypothetical protein KC799_11060 [candidate division KSB1 bacterium]|nr:hypothetical protein [candidate division KSB1 bacterium]